jgi:beta-glucosidase
MTSSLINESVRQRVEDLLSRMNIDQKIGQMTQAERMAVTPDEVRDYHIGSVLSGGGSCPGDNLPADWVAMNNEYWAASVFADEQHLPIPILYAVDAIHGHNNVRGATVFPHNIGLGASNDPDLLRRIGMATAREILATGVEWTFAPTLAVAQDIHWGRTYESYSEHPDIVASYAGAFVDGLQGDLGADSVIACVKHFVADGGTTNGIDQGESTLTLSELENIHVKPYLPAIDSGVLTIMASFSSWNGTKCHGHRELLTDLLKDKLQFEGIVVSDWDGIDYLSEDYSDAVALGVNAGIDMFMVSENWKEFITYLKQHVQRGSVPIERINDAVRRILSVKIAYGLFEKPSPANRSWSNHECYGGMDHRELAREAVRKSLVLLKNEASILPLDKDTRILVAGKNANDRGHQCGGFTIAWQGQSGNEVIEGGTSIWEGITAVAPNAMLSEDGSAADPQLHDVAIAVIGERPYAEGMGDIRADENVIVEAGSQIRGIMNVLTPYGDSLELAKLHPEDLETIQNISSKGIPVVVVLVSGRPLLVNPELAAADAFVAAWLPGSEGQGVADVLFGDFDFEGRLSFSWPHSARQYDKAAATRPVPLFPLGYGLSYAGEYAKRSIA